MTDLTKHQGEEHMNNDIRNLLKWLNEGQETPLDRQALARVLAMAEQQEPVVFYRCNGCGHAYEQVHPTSCDCMEAGGFDRVEYYTFPPASKPLTDEQIFELAREHQDWDRNLIRVRSFARAIEAAHGITKGNT